MRASFFFAVLLGILSAGCAPQAAPGSASAPGVKDDAQACAARGGSMHRICLMGELACVITYPDAGKTCTDKDECTGQCRFAGGTPPPPNAIARGVCQQTSDPCGCFSQIIKGKVQPALCVD